MTGPDCENKYTGVENNRILHSVRPSMQTKSDKNVVNSKERATELGRRTREEISKSGIKLTALRFQTMGRHQKFPSSLRGKQINTTIKDSA